MTGEKELDAFKTEREKATFKITINSTMMGALFFVLTFIMADGWEKFDSMAMGQLVLAIPLLYVSILANYKIAYRKERKAWDVFGWFTGNTGGLVTLNAIGLMIANVSSDMSLAYFGLLVALMVIYSAINIVYVPRAAAQKLYKFIYFFVIIVFGGLMPLAF